MTAAVMQHDVFVHADLDSYGARIGPFLEEGVEGGEAVLAVTGADYADVLRDAIGRASERVTFIDRDGFYTRPEAAIAGYDATVRRLLREGVRAVRLTGQLPRCSRDAEWARWVAYDAILNRAFAHHPVWIMCTYDTRETPDAALRGARCAHRRILRDRLDDNPDYDDPARVVRAHAEEPDPAPLPGLHELRLDDDGPRAFREVLEYELELEGVPRAIARDFVVAAGEVFANAHRHGGAGPAVRLGRVDGEVVCEIADAGPGMSDPLAGYLPPRAGARRGAGLWVARQLTRRLQLLSSQDGLTVRLWA